MKRAGRLIVCIEMQSKGSTVAAQGTGGLAAGRIGHTSVDLIVLDGFFASGLSVTLDTLATANVLATALGGVAPFSWSVRSLEGAAVRSSAGTLLEVDGRLDDANAALWLVFGQGMADAGRVLADVARPDSRALASLVSSWQLRIGLEATRRADAMFTRPSQRQPAGNALTTASHGCHRRPSWFGVSTSVGLETALIAPQAPYASKPVLEHSGAEPE
jgi:hypothetical protein